MPTFLIRVFVVTGSAVRRSALDPAAEAWDERLTAAPDQSRCLGKEIYLYLPNGVAKSSLANNPLERRLLKRGTIRNWRTVSNLYQMCLDCG